MVVTLLGRDILCKLKARNILFSRWNTDRIPEFWQMVMPNEKTASTPCSTPQYLPTVYWLRFMENHLSKDFEEWRA